MPEPDRTARPTPPTRPLHTVARIGPFFAVRTDPPGPAGPRAEGYVPLAELYVAGPPATERLEAAPPALRHRYTTVARQLGTDELRVAASLGFQGLAGRLWSLAVGCAALTGQVPDLEPRRLWWHPEHSASRELWLPDADVAPDPVAPAPVADLAERVRATVLDQHLPPPAPGGHGGLRALGRPAVGKRRLGAGRRARCTPRLAARAAEAGRRHHGPGPRDGLGPRAGTGPRPCSPPNRCAPPATGARAPARRSGAPPVASTTGCRAAACAVTASCPACPDADTRPASGPPGAGWCRGPAHRAAARLRRDRSRSVECACCHPRPPRYLP